MLEMFLCCGKHPPVRVLRRAVLVYRELSFASHDCLQEGVAIMSFHLVRGGVFQEEGISKLLTDAETRNLSDNLSDLKAQVAANQQGSDMFCGRILYTQYAVCVVCMP